ncbi:flavin-containing monooxygenase [Janibacter sp. GXQ6167]|uniref:flavin-containing monooxygenase n=1 Tax=Janibacter sp. GXQ6167 TaxID=3240791 RepID=UPI00352433E7
MSSTSATASTRHDLADLPQHTDVLIVGAGISGIAAAYRITELSPTIDYRIIEAREGSGGTWDLFRYPGVRSDSDMYSLSFPFAPWTGETTITEGGKVLDYLRETAAAHGLDERIHYGARLIEMRWSTPDLRWTLTLQSPDGSTREVTAGYVHLASGYYRYDRGYEPTFPGSEDFAGQIVHPQLWPEDLDYQGKRVVIIGSGATAVTLGPAMTDRAAHVTILQRTPTYIYSMPGRDPIARLAGAVLSPERTAALARSASIRSQALLYKLSRTRPELAKRFIMSGMKRQLPRETIEEHFTPPYGVWDQRLCAVPDGDLFAAIRRGRLEMVTARIRRFVADGIELTDGTLVPADLIVTATGLSLQIAGGAQMVVDGEPVDLASTFAYRGIMLSGVPNASMTVGYTNAAWTLRADLVAQFVARVLRRLGDRGAHAAVAVAPEGMAAHPILDIAAGYVQRSVAELPKAGDREPWLITQDYASEKRTFAEADLDGELLFVSERDRRARLPKGAPAGALPSA